MAEDAESSEEILKRLFKSEYNSVLAYCVRRVGFDDGEDAAAEVFSVAWRHIDEIDWTTVRPWLFGIARKIVSNRWRSVSRTRNLTRKLSGLAPEIATPPDLYAVRSEADREVVATLRRLSASDQEILMLSAWEELSAPEIAVALDISAAAASQRLHRAKKRLANALDGHRGDRSASHPANDGVRR